MATNAGSYAIHSEPHGPHWIAWLTRGGDQMPDRSIVLVGETQEEAEGRAQAWIDSIYNVPE